MSTARTVRLSREIKNMKEKPVWGITCHPLKEDVYDVLQVKMAGPRGSPYEKGLFELIINIPDKYPFEPPQVKFVTPVYHPNIDKGGRICMNMLKMPTRETEGWLPTITIETLLISIQTLLANPNPDDPLMMEIAMEYKSDIDKFKENASKHTEQYAV
ncbi:unnamed protein product [Danaus chrysippus]|uniref:E2 ubiquitin-conjugating enzyme n=1 Tax=Danaus chrysippus TaxID=151541 RepID=A0A8J2VX33_9NEOP|nr:unnamed protein product [Danaus chrysippus]